MRLAATLAAAPCTAAFVQVPLPPGMEAMPVPTKQQLAYQGEISALIH
eukprot:COSAG05_NODE_12073_length_484_cov_11.220779_1_plen_47_part_01